MNRGTFLVTMEGGGHMLGYMLPFVVCFTLLCLFATSFLVFPSMLYILFPSCLVIPLGCVDVVLFYLSFDFGRP